jgi:hypothetical protein
MLRKKIKQTIISTIFFQAKASPFAAKQFALYDARALQIRTRKKGVRLWINTPSADRKRTKRFATLRPF